MVICLERGADLHMAQLMPLPLTVSCFSRIQIGFTFLVPAHTGSPGKRAVKRVCVCVCLASYIPRSSEDRSSWIFFIHVVRGRPGGYLQFFRGGLKTAWLASVFVHANAQRK